MNKELEQIITPLTPAEKKDLLALLRKYENDLMLDGKNDLFFC